MATCQYCSFEMLDNVPCTQSTYSDFPDGIGRDRRPYGTEYPGRRMHANCRDCGTPLGGLHHPGCDVERCPACGGQAVSCDCAQPTDEWADEWPAAPHPPKDVVGLVRPEQSRRAVSSPP